MKRGALIVVEGVDRTGKSTQCKALVENLLNKHIKAEYLNFPRRTTDIGQVINGYLTSKKELCDEVIHLLFSANRWECVHTMLEKLQSGVSLVVDRYCYSGVAFSNAKGLDLKWCKSPDVGLPRPDHVFFLTMPPEASQARNGFGNERYEVPEFQQKVLGSYLELKEDNWEILQADRSIEVIQEELVKKSLGVIDNVGTKPIGKIWT